MDELVIGDQKYISSKKAAEITGYAKDYVGQLCREGRVEARLVGRNWYIREAAIRDHRFGAVNLEDPQGLKEEKPVKPSWEAPKYTKVTEDEEVPVRKEVHEENSRVADAASQLQSAWQDWFANNARKIDQTVDESHQIEQREAEIEESSINKVEDITTSEEESVPIQIHKNAEAAEDSGELQDDRAHEYTVETKNIPVEDDQGKRSGRRLYTIMRIISAFVAVTVLVLSLLSVGALDIFGIRSSEIDAFRFISGSQKYSR